MSSGANLELSLQIKRVSVPPVIMTRHKLGTLNIPPQPLTRSFAGFLEHRAKFVVCGGVWGSDAEPFKGRFDRDSHSLICICLQIWITAYD